MKKLLVLLLLLFLAVAINAQTDNITGDWLMTKAEVNGEVSEPYQAFEFKADGKLLTMGMKIASWKYDEAANSFVMRSDMDKDFNGEGKALKLTDKEMVLEKDGGKFYYSRINYDVVYKNNEQSGLTGVWQVENNEGALQLVKFEKPDEYTFTDVSEGATETMRGNWIFNPEEQSLIVVSFHNPLKGKSKIVELTSDKLVIEKDGETFTAKKEKSVLPKIEKLTFKEEDFPEDQQQDRLPEMWRDFERMIAPLQNVEELTFKTGKLIRDMKTFDYTTYISRIEVDPEKPSVTFTNLAVEHGDTSQYSQKHKGGLMERYNEFFPKEEPQPYRAAGTETITVAAGTFKCTVIEGFDSENKIKYWLVNNMPGVYAKTIEEIKSPFGDSDYFVTELENIKYKK